MKQVLAFFCLFSLSPLLIADAPDTYQADIPPDLVAKVNDAKRKQVSDQNLDEAVAELKDVLQVRPDYYRALFNPRLSKHWSGRWLSTTNLKSRIRRFLTASGGLT
jgi:hypothetical protein